MIKVHKLCINGLRKYYIIKTLRSGNVIEDQQLSHKFQFVRNHKCNHLNEKRNKAIELYRNEDGKYIWFMIHDSFMNRYKISKCPYCNEQLDKDIKYSRLKDYVKSMGVMLAVFTVIIGFICLLPENTENITYKDKYFKSGADESIPDFYEYEYGYDSEGKRIIKKTYYNKITVIEKIDP